MESFLLASGRGLVSFLSAKKDFLFYPLAFLQIFPVILKKQCLSKARLEVLYFLIKKEIFTQSIINRKNLQKSGGNVVNVEVSGMQQK